MADIFISYSSHDRDKALSLAEELRALGTSVWIDQVIDGATQWSSEIAQALDECKALILLVSKSSLASKNCVKEVTIAAESDKHILPIDLEDIKLPKEFKYHLAGIQRVAYSNREAIQRTLENLNLVCRTFLSDNGTSKTFSPETDRNVRPTEPIRIAVLPFDDLSPKKDNAWFADGMMDELIGTLSQVQKLRVASRSEVIYYKKHRPKAKKIADDLKVRYLIEGSVRKAGEKIRITASLSDMGYGEQLWMNNYDGTFDDVFDFQETVSKKIAEALELKLTPQEEKAIVEQPTKNTEAYELYLRGLEFHRLLTRDGYEKALKLYEAAVGLDPKYVDAYLVIANISAAYYRECSRDPKWLRRAEDNLKKAEAISGETAKTLLIHGEIEWQKGNFEKAEEVLIRGAELDPKYGRTFNMLGNIYLKLERQLEASQAFEKALNLTESNVTYFNMLLSLANQADQQNLISYANKAIPVMEKYLQSSNDDLNARVNYAFTLYWANRINEALIYAEELCQIEAMDGMALYNLSSLFDKLGYPNKSVILLEQSVEKGFREIEILRMQHYNEVELQQQLVQIIEKLESIIKAEDQIPQT